MVVASSGTGFRGACGGRLETRKLQRLDIDLNGSEVRSGLVCQGLCAAENTANCAGGVSPTGIGFYDERQRADAGRFRLGNH